eukprot:scpid108576/ scgid9695/ 
MAVALCTYTSTAQQRILRLADTQSCMPRGIHQLSELSRDCLVRSSGLPTIETKAAPRLVPHLRPLGFFWTVHDEIGMEIWHKSVDLWVRFFGNSCTHTHT